MNNSKKKEIEKKKGNKPVARAGQGWAGQGMNGHYQQNNINSDCFIAVNMYIIIMIETNRV